MRVRFPSCSTCLPKKNSSLHFPLPRKNKTHSAPLHYQFPYVKFHGKYYPLIPLTLSRAGRAVSTFALIDSGASISVFRPEIADALRLSKKDRENFSLSTADGRLGIGVAKIGIAIEETRFSAKIGFSDTTAASFNILGRENIFSRFSICFNEIMKTVILVPLESVK